MSAERVSRRDIDALAAAGHLDADARDLALALIDAAPDTNDWRRFLDRFLLTAAAIALTAALVFFIAYNWRELGRFAKLGLLEIAVAGAALASLRFPGTDLRARALLLVAMLAVGPLLAFVGQTYQTGADSYELFLAWALLSLPWTFLGAWRITWSLWLLIVNLSILLYFEQAFRPWMNSGFGPLAAAAAMAANAVFVALLEVWGHGRLDGDGRIAERLGLAVLLSAALFLYFHFLFEGREHAYWELPVSVAAFAAVFGVYRYLRLDLVALAGWSFVGIAAVAATLAKLLDWLHADALTFLATGGAVIGLSAFAARWLRALNRMESAS